MRCPSIVLPGTPPNENGEESLVACENGQFIWQKSASPDRRTRKASPSNPTGAGRSVAGRLRYRIFPARRNVVEKSRRSHQRTRKIVGQNRLRIQRGGLAASRNEAGVEPCAPIPNTITEPDCWTTPAKPTSPPTSISPPSKQRAAPPSLTHGRPDGPGEIPDANPLAKRSEPRRFWRVDCHANQTIPNPDPSRASRPRLPRSDSRPIGATAALKQLPYLRPNPAQNWFRHGADMLYDQLAMRCRELGQSHNGWFRQSAGSQIT